MDFILTFGRQKYLHLAEVRHEVARADEVTGPGSQWGLRRDVLYATAPPQGSANPGGPGAPSAETPVLSHRSCLHLQIRLHAGKIISFHPQGKADCQIFSFPILTCATLKCLMYDQKSPTPTGPSQQIKSAAAASLLQKRGICPKMSPFCFTWYFKAVRAQNPKK